MKKLVFFIPVIIFILFLGFVAISAFGAISPIAIGWLVLFAVAGILLSKNISWGAIFGIFPAIHFIYMSTQETGQVLHLELPLGIVTLLFYLACGYFIYSRKTVKQKL